jgi:NADH-ubiquinone oxidoreductase chain 5
MITFISNRIGDGFLILFFGGLVLGGAGPSTTSPSSYLLSGLILFFARITKSAQAPFSRWLPEAIAAPTPISALVHSSTLVTAGVFLLFKFLSFPIFPLFLIGRRTFFISRLSARVERDFKKIVAFSTLSQIGLLFIIMRVGAYWLFFFHLISHAFFKSFLFIGVGNLLHLNLGRQDKRRIALYPGAFLTLTIQIPLLSLMGLGFLSGIVSKDLIISSLLVTTLLSCVIPLGLVLSFFYSIKILIALLNRGKIRPISRVRNSFYFIIRVFLLVLGSVFFAK